MFVQTKKKLRSELIGHHFLARRNPEIALEIHGLVNMELFRILYTFMNLTAVNIRISQNPILRIRRVAKNYYLTVSEHRASTSDSSSMDTILFPPSTNTATSLRNFPAPVWLKLTG